MQEWLEDRPQPAGFCDGCGAPVTEADRFCTSCGRPTRDLCSWCNATLPAGARFCTACGRPAVRDRTKVYQRGAVAGKPIAGFGFRAGVFLVDGIITSTVQGLINQVTSRLWSDASVLTEIESLNDRVSQGEPVGAGDFLAVIPTWFWWYIALWSTVFLLLGWTWNSLGWSPAQRVIGLRIVDAAGNPPGWRRGLGRSAASWLSGLPLGLGYLAAAWHPEKRTWHDRIAGTWVVDVREQR